MVYLLIIFPFSQYYRTVPYRGNTAHLFAIYRGTSRGYRGFNAVYITVSLSTADELARSSPFYIPVVSS